MIWDNVKLVCRDCGHIARDHIGYTGGCSGCWASKVIRCSVFRPTRDAQAFLEASGEATPESISRAFSP